LARARIGTGEEFCGCGTGNRDEPVPAAREAGAKPGRAGENAFDAQKSETDTGTAHIYDGIDPADLVEVDLSRR
jgi:hypothetical protein